MDSTHTALLYIPDVSESASLAHVFLGMENNSLLSVSQLLNEGYYITFHIDRVTIFNYEINAIMKGHRDSDTGLWYINLRPKKQQTQIAETNNL